MLPRNGWLSLGSGPVSGHRWVSEFSGITEFSMHDHQLLVLSLVWTGRQLCADHDAGRS